MAEMDIVRAAAPIRGVIEPFGDPYLCVEKLGQCDLVYGLYRSKFSFPMYSNGRRIRALLRGYYGGY